MEYDESVLTQRVDDVDQRVCEAGRGGHRMTFHCARCNTILGDSFGVCGEMKSLDSIMCLRVTSDVVIGDVMEPGHKGEMANCFYSLLKCRSCFSAVGKVIHSAPSRLATIRSLFLLDKANIACYILDSRSMVKASALTFDLQPLGPKIVEMSQQVKAKLDHMSHVKSRLADGSVTDELDK
ncbi:putative protein Mis18-beta-like [Scophthalmus maximus]|uniref:Mis18 domain-containing protein n=1 Tax=Scophthalmus maximus TaxID=52904 RepID=A0A2U9CHM9_SCOMX|nr:putative protein Mis18-beta-like [Scophthalmus maximus]KAF0043920.1 hypothetical protein F2P81_003078 [Scophthalmus maximus]